MKNMGDGRRVARVERLVQETIAKFLISGFRMPLPGIITVASVKMQGDLRAAKIYVSVLGNKELGQQAVDLLQERAFEIQNFIGKELQMRYCPKLTFYQDHATEEILKVERILQDLETERQRNTPKAENKQDDDE